MFQIITKIPEMIYIKRDNDKKEITPSLFRSFMATQQLEHFKNILKKVLKYT